MLFAPECDARFDRRSHSAGPPMTQPQQPRSLFIFLSVVALAGLVAPSPARATQDPPAVTPCEAKSFKFDKVKAACTEGGRSAAKKLMKGVVKKAKAAGEDVNCKSCHTSLKTFALTKDAHTQLDKWL